MSRAIYIRTSTDGQDGAAQREALEQAAKARGWATFQTFQDIGHSGAKSSRPALDRLRRDVATGKVTVVMTYSLDRLGRSLLDVVRLLTDWTVAGCAVISLREAIDLSTPTGRLQAQILAAFSEFERECIKARVRSGLDAARARGVRLGRPKREIDTARAAVLVQELGSIRAAAKAMGVPRATLHDALQAAAL